MPVRHDSSFCRGRPAHLRNISPRKGPILGTTFQLDAACGQSPADGSACTSNEACKCRNPKLTTFRLLGTRHTAYASLARETRRSNLRGISKTKSERVRRTWIPTSLITSYSSVPSVERTTRTHPGASAPIAYRSNSFWISGLFRFSRVTTTTPVSVLRSTCSPWR